NSGPDWCCPDIRAAGCDNCVSNEMVLGGTRREMGGLVRPPNCLRLIRGVLSCVDDSRYWLWLKIPRGQPLAGSIPAPSISFHIVAWSSYNGAPCRRSPVRNT